MPAQLGLGSLYSLLKRQFGFLDWWPGETADEIVIGAVLTQQASWRNVEMAISNLRAGGLLSLDGLADADLGTIERCVRPSGFYRQKAKRLKELAAYVKKNHGSLDGLFEKSAAELRKELLELEGVGPETADSILLYAAGKPVFVIDAYTKRIMNRVYGTDPDIGYHELQSLITGGIPEDAELYNDFHAQFVELGKNFCRTKPMCGDCPVNRHCRYYKTAQHK